MDEPRMPASTIRDVARREHIARVLQDGDERRILMLLDEHGNVRGHTPHAEFVALFADTTALLRGKGNGLLRTLLLADVPSMGRASHAGLRYVAAHVVGARLSLDYDVRDGWKTLHHLAEDPHMTTRNGVVEALHRHLADQASRVAAAVQHFSGWTDGFLHAAVALEVLTHRSVLNVASPDGVMARLEEMVALLENAPRSAERTQGLRRLAEVIPDAVAACVARIPQAEAWLLARVATRDPRMRTVLEAALGRLHAKQPSPTLARTVELFDAYAPPRRDPRSYVGPTRGRGRSRRG
jgi:hypothetical protein